MGNTSGTSVNLTVARRKRTRVAAAKYGTHDPGKGWGTYQALDGNASRWINLQARTFSDIENLTARTGCREESERCNRPDSGLPL